MFPETRHLFFLALQVYSIIGKHGFMTIPPVPYVALMYYINQPWMKSYVWSIESLRVFKRSVPTTNETF